MKQIPLYGPPEAPKLRAATERLRALNRVHLAPVAVSMTEEGEVSAAQTGRCYGCEQLPGSGKHFDAVRSARRLLAALRDMDAVG